MYPAKIYLTSRDPENRFESTKLRSVFVFPLTILVRSCMQLQYKMWILACNGKPYIIELYRILFFFFF